VSTEQTLPSNVRATAPLMQVVRLAESGLEESVMLAFVTNSETEFSLGSEEIIYLTDIGVPATVISAMIQHAQAMNDSPSGLALDDTVPSLAMKQSASSPYASSAYALVPPPPSFNSSVVTPVNYTE